MASRLVLSSFAKRRFSKALSSPFRQYHRQSALFAAVHHTPLLMRHDDGETEKNRRRQSLLYSPIKFTTIETTTSLGMLFGTSRWHSSAAAPTTKRSKSTADMSSDKKDDTTAQLRERAAEQARKSAKVAKKGARTVKEMVQQYGPVFVGTYFGLYVATLASLFGGIDSGLLDPVTLIQYFHWGHHEVSAESKSTVDLVVQLLEKNPWTEPYAPAVARNPHTANLAVAWVATKFTEPIRLLVTLGTVPRIARWLGRVPAQPKDQDKATVAEKKQE